VQPDSIVPGVLSPSKGEPGNPQALNRYAYVDNNPLRYTDPTGMFSEDKIMKYFGVKTWKEVLALFEKGGAYEGEWGWLEVLHDAYLRDKVTLAMETSTQGGVSENNRVFEGIFVEDDHGQLRLQDTADSTLYDPATALYSKQHNAYHLYGWNPPDVDQPGMWMEVGHYQTYKQYLHLKSVDWNYLLNPLVLEHVIEPGGATLFTAGVTSIFGALSVTLCSNPITCAGGVEMGIATVASGAATGLLFHGTVEIGRHVWHEAATYSP